MWNGQSVSIVLPTYREKASIRRCVEAFASLGVVDEVIVVNNNAESGTSQEVARTGAREVFEPRQGYGFAIRRGLAEARGEFLVLCEPDDTFVARDLFKLLAYTDEHDVVFGSRTVREYIWTGANMGPFLRWGNFAVAKLLEFAFNANHLSDVGCTFRLLRRSAYESMRPHFTVGGSHFGPEMMLLATRLGMSYVQIPINYQERAGRSQVTGSFLKAFLLGCVMIKMIVSHRLSGRLRRLDEPKETAGAWALSPWWGLTLPPLFAFAALGLWRAAADPALGDASAFVLLAWNDAGVAPTPLSLFTDQWHPYLYAWLITLAARLSGGALLWLRVPGVICFILDLWLVRRLVHALCPEQSRQRLAMLAALAVCCASPLLLAQAMLTDIDGTVLTTAMLAVCVAAARCFDAVAPGPPAGLGPGPGMAPAAAPARVPLALAVAFAVALWCKLTTPLVVFPAAALTALSPTLRRGAARVLAGATAGALLFLLSWYAVNALLGLPPGEVFRRLGVALTFHGASTGGERRLVQAATAAAHFGLPAATLAAAAAVVLLLRGRGAPAGSAGARFLAWVTLGVGGGYLVIGQAVFGAAKYHTPVVPLGAAMAAAVFAAPVADLPRRGMGAAVALSLLGAAAASWLAPDAAFVLYREAKRMAEAGGSFSDIAARAGEGLAVPAALALLVAVLLLRSGKWRWAAPAALAVVVGVGAGTVCRNLAFDGAITYAYGAEGGRETLRLLDVAGARSVLCLEGGVIAPRQPPDKVRFFWLGGGRRLSALLSGVRRHDPDAIVVGPALLPLSMMRTWESDPAYRATLADRYVYFRHQDFETWLRRSLAPRLGLDQ